MSVGRIHYVVSTHLIINCALRKPSHSRNEPGIGIGSIGTVLHESIKGSPEDPIDRDFVGNGDDFGLDRVWSDARSAAVSENDVLDLVLLTDHFLVWRPPRNLGYIVEVAVGHGPGPGFEYQFLQLVNDDVGRTRESTVEELWVLREECDSDGVYHDRSCRSENSTAN